MMDENENKDEQPEKADPETEVMFLKNEMAAATAAHEAERSELKRELEDERIDRILEREATKLGAFNPGDMRRFLEGEIKLQDKKVYVNDVEVSRHFTKMKDGEYWNLFRDSFETYKSTGGKKPTDPVDVRRLSGEEYRALRESNPAALGLRAKK